MRVTYEELMEIILPDAGEEEDNYDLEEEESEKRSEEEEEEEQEEEEALDADALKTSTPAVDRQTSTPYIVTGHLF